SLLAPAIRARIVVIADYLKKLDAAAALASSTLAEVSSPASILLVTESIGRQFFFQKRYAEAVEWLRRAVNADVEGFAHIRMEARVYLAAALAESNGEPSEVLHLVEEGAA